MMALRQDLVVCAFLLLGFVCSCGGRVISPIDEEFSLNKAQERQQTLSDEIRALKRMLERAEAERELEDVRQQIRREEKVHATAFLERFGYLPVLPTNASHDAVSMKKAIIKMQRMYHLRETGELDALTIRSMQVPRCGLPDNSTSERLGASLKELIAINFQVPGYKWQKQDLTWHLKNFHPRLTPEVTENALRQAFNFWSDAAGLTFTETDSKADINMEFVWRAHQDGQGNAFDGPGGVLAHAFYPESGETHFDYEETWTDGTTEGINLMIVATHELGHALGLGHSQVKGALMAPYYQGYDPKFKLSDDDIQAIQSLYGESRPPDRPTDRPTERPADRPTTTTERSADGGAPDTCSVVYKAITQTHDYRIYVYNGRWMWRTSEYGLDQGFPLTISTYYQTPPDDITAAIFSWKTYYTYFFKGKTVWQYYGFQLASTKTIDSQGYPESPKAAVASKDGTFIYLIKGGYAWQFNEETFDASNPVPFEQLFPGAPTTFDSIVRIVNDPHVYFFNGPSYIKYSEESRQVLQYYPKQSAGPWMGPACGAKPYTPK